MIDSSRLYRDLAGIGAGDWQSTIAPLISARLSDEAHGDFARWKQSIDALPPFAPATLTLSDDAPGGDRRDLTTEQRKHIRQHLLELQPWRKGPFNICGIPIDAEWRSNLKWDRIKNQLAPLKNRKILDIGSGNGYYLLRMLGAGPKIAIGIDPTLLYVCQFLAIEKLLGIGRAYVLPLRLHELPLPCPIFDTTFSMGVLYHQRCPETHLQQLSATLRLDGQLVLETLVLPGNHSEVLNVDGRYARMRNLYHLPTVSVLEAWLAAAGFGNIRTIDICRTTVEEQRSTTWMPFESLAEALDPADPSRTIEGWPAPTRAVILCDKRQ